MGRFKKSARQKYEEEEREALRAANLESSIRAEVNERLKAGTYGDLYNDVPEEVNSEEELLEEENIETNEETEAEETKIPGIEYELEIEDGDQAELTKEQLDSGVSKIEYKEKSPKPTSTRKRKLAEISGAT